MRSVTRLPSPASLGAKLVMIMTAVGIIGAIGISLLLASIITPSFEQLETRAIAGHVERTRAALAEFQAKVESAVRDYGDWTASYDYMANPSATFERESFSPLAMSNIGVHGMAYVAPDRRIVIARWRDPASGAERPAMRAALLAMIARTDLPRVLGARNSGGFYARVGTSVAAIGVAQVRRSDGSGTPRGYVLMARVISSKQIADLLQLGARIDLTATGDDEVVTPDSRTLSIAVPMIGADGHAVAATRFSVPRDVSRLGRRMLMLAVAGSTILLLLVLIVLRRLIEQLVLRPLHRVESHMQRVSASGSLGLLEEEKRGDEIGSLGRSFNTMLRQLKDLREQIEVQSFDLGRSESAVAVMHNVRNALNPISTILSQGIAQPPPIDRATIDRAVAELAQDDMPPARRRKLSAFVAAAVQAQDDDRQATRRELGVGREALAHVLDIIGQQQKAAHERPTLEVCDITDIIARNATIARYSQGVSIAFSFPGDTHRVMANRVILSQVIGNLFGNAAESIVARGAGSGMIAAAVREEGGRVVIEIRDDGEGFTPEVAATLFQRGFSTRAHKSGGLGLHWCANSMNAMEGTLRLESEGKGMGAVAILTLRGVDEAVAEAA
ncbi:HAMP domain-containing protein [Sphingomonas ginsenosidivorax]|uniref:histidine kinase n=1 Tax=Sphingomonas ginsenosidivorax TaxID=862135 RepID=A0A5C6UG13_9SPHN|nr:CHASE4 domain-containing protein [Sphingomonas ginsenosidivorax]TXC70878.1 HAMP domain-containing protein [Sphingomonas ginsenosidivorax]